MRKVIAMMNKMMVSMLAGAASLLVADTCAAHGTVRIGFHDQWTNNLTGDTYDIWRVYANVGVGGHLYAVWGNTNPLDRPFSLEISHGAGGFYVADLFGTPVGPGVIAADGTYDFVNSGQGGHAVGSLDASSYLTIGLENGYAVGTNAAAFTSGFAAQFTWGTGFVAGNPNGAYFITPDNPQGEADENGEVLMMQLTVLEGTLISGTVNFDYIIGGGHSTASAQGVMFILPAPGAMALLGLAGLVGARRRRA